MTRKYLAFDIETATDVSGDDFDWRRHRPLGISCAAALPSDADEPIIWHGNTGEDSPADRMSLDDARCVVHDLAKMVRDGYTLVTWNGLGFDFDVLAEEAKALDECKELALSQVDMMFHVFCEKGFPVALDKAAHALGIPGKPRGMSGFLAPQLWKQGRHQDVIDYVSQDVRTTLQVAQTCEKQRRFQWTTRKGTTSRLNLNRGWLNVRDALQLPEPDTSWMDAPIPRRQFTQWLGSGSDFRSP